MANRREFLRLMGSAMGCALLAGCGGGGGGPSGISGGGGTGGGGGAAPLPSGFRLTPVLDNGNSLGGGLSVVGNLVRGPSRRSPSDHPFAWYFDLQDKQQGQRAPAVNPKRTQILGAFPGQAWVTDQGQLGFLALDSQGSRGMYLADIDDSGPTPRAVNIRKVLRIGDLLPDKAVSAVNISAGDVGGNGTVAMRVETGDNGRVSVYVYKDGQLQPLLSTYQRIPSLFPRGSTSAMLFGAISVHDDDSILIAPPLTSAQDINSLGQGLLYLPNGRLSDAALVLHKGDMVADTTSTVRTIGTFQLHDDGRYIVMGSAIPAGYTNAQRPSGPEGTDPLTYLMTGNVRQGQSFPRLLSAHPSLGASRRRQTDQTFVEGTTLLTPRIGSDGTTAYVVQPQVGQMSLYINGNPVITAVRDGSGSVLSPGGSVVTELSAPVVGTGGHVYCVLGTRAGQELSIFNGTSAATIVRTGDPLGDRHVVSIVMGQTARQVNRAGRIAFRVDYTDATSSLVIGDPV